MSDNGFPVDGGDFNTWGPKLLARVQSLIDVDGGLADGVEADIVQQVVDLVGDALGGVVSVNGSSGTITLESGTNISVSEDAGTITIHGLITTEVIRDTIATALSGTGGITVTPDDGGDTIQISVSGLLDQATADTLYVGKPSPATAGMVPVTDGTEVDWVLPNRVDIQSISGGIDLTGATDMSAEFTGWLAELATIDGGAIGTSPGGQLLLSQTAVLPPGVGLDLGYGAAGVNSGVKNGFTRLWWAGANTDNVIEVASGAGSIGWLVLRNFFINAPFDRSNNFKSGVVFDRRVDTYLDMHHVWVSGADDYGIEWRFGGINVHPQYLRFDNCVKGSMLWIPGGHDNFSLTHWASDNSVAGGASGPSGRAFVYEGAAASDTWQQRFHFDDAKIETNFDLPVDAAQFEFHVDIENSSRTSVFVTFGEQVWHAPASGLTRKDFARVYPASDMQLVKVHNATNQEIVGVPSLTNTRGTVKGEQVIAPFGVAPGTGPVASQMVAAEWVGEINLIGEMYVHNTMATPIIHKAVTDASLAGVTVYPGMFFLDPATRSSGKRILRECTAVGTLGTLAGVTASGSSGTATITVNTTAGLRIGQWITFGTPTQFKRITNINDDTLVVTLQSNTTATTAGDAVSYMAPTFRDHRIGGTLEASTVWDPGSAPAGGLAAGVAVTVTGAALGDYCLASFSQTVPDGCHLMANVTATNTVRVVLVNHTGGAVDLASGTLRVIVWPQ